MPKAELKVSEHSMQSAFFDWWGHFSKIAKIDERLMFAIPNGAKLPWKKDKKGRRYSPEAIKLLEEGLRPGVPDVMLAVVTSVAPGLYIEFKTSGNGPSDEQFELIALLRKQGYHVVVAYTIDEGMRAVQAYLGYVPQR